jgi:hypothetical protein
MDDLDPDPRDALGELPFDLVVLIDMLRQGDAGFAIMVARSAEVLADVGSHVLPHVLDEPDLRSETPTLVLMRVILGGNEVNSLDFANLSYYLPSGRSGASGEVLCQAECISCHPELLGPAD